MVSGFFIAQKAELRQGTDIYLKNRFKKLYSVYFLAFIFIAVKCFWRAESSEGRWKILNNVLLYSCMIQHIGIPCEYRFNDYLWYVVYLFIFGTIIYHIYIHKSKKINMTIAILSCVLFYAISFTCNHTINGENASLMYIRILPIPAYRSIADIYLGCICYEVYKKRSEVNIPKRWGLILLGILSAWTVFIQILRPFSIWEISVLISFFICICISSTYEWKKNGLTKLIGFLGEKTYVVYCAQATAFMFLSANLTLIELFAKVIFVAFVFDIMQMLMLKMVEKIRYKPSEVL